jgi:uncharacterized protein with PIN domain
MKSIHLRVYEELNDYLPRDKMKQSFVCRFEGAVTVAALLQAAGIPIACVDLILRNSEPIRPDIVAQDGDHISAYPVFEALDLRGTTLVRNTPLRQPRFVTCPGLRRLGSYLRMLGFDTCLGATQLEAAEIAKIEGRILLAQGDIPPDASHALCVRDAKPRLQAADVLERLDLNRLIVPLGRCPRCNEATVHIDSGRRCEKCGRTYRCRGQGIGVRPAVKSARSCSG